MQKFTIFTIIFSVMVISITDELITQDYLEKLYPPSAAASILDSLEDAEPVELEDDRAPEPEIKVAETVDPEPAPPITEVSEIEDKDLKISESIIGLLATIDIPSLKYQPINYTGKLFDVLPTTDLVNPDDVALGQLVVPGEGDKVDLLGAAYEFQFEEKSKARRLYQELKKSAQNFANIDVNETDQFGDNSFYINHQAKVGEVFLITIKGTTVYALAYGKEYHETFKPFLGLLL